YTTLFRSARAGGAVPERLPRAGAAVRGRIPWPAGGGREARRRGAPASGDRSAIARRPRACARGGAGTGIRGRGAAQPESAAGEEGRRPAWRLGRSARVEGRGGRGVLAAKAARRGGGRGAGDPRL